MAVKIRLARRGRKRKPFYHIVVADARSPRDGKFIEAIGSYNPMTSPATIELDQNKALDWMNKGAQPTETARAILRFKGVLYKKHLMRGVSKGAFSEEKANEMWQTWIDAKETKVAARKAQAELDKKAKWAAISGTPGAPPEVVSADAGAAEAFTGDVPPVDVPEAEAVVEAPAAEAVAEVAEEASPAVEEAKEVVAEEAAPVAEEAKEVVADAKEVVEEAAPVAEEVKEEVADVKEEVKEAAPAAEEVKEEVAAVEEKVEEAKEEVAAEKAAEEE